MKETLSILRITRLPNWLGDFSIDYDGKYIALYGKDKNYGAWWTIAGAEIEYEEMCLGAAFAEGRKLSPQIIKETPDFIYIDIGDQRETLAWTNLVDDSEYGHVFEPIP